MRVTGEIICLIIIFSSCAEPARQENFVTEIDTTLDKSVQTTEQFSIIVYEVDSFEDMMWENVEYKIDSLILRNRELEKKQGKKPTFPRVRVQDASGAVRDYGTLEDIKKRLLENKKEN